MLEPKHNFELKLREKKLKFKGYIHMYLSTAQVNQTSMYVSELLFNGNNWH